MSRAPRTITLGRATINCRCHVCAFFHSSEDEYNVLMPFILEGLVAGDTAIQILDKDRWAGRIRRLSDRGIDTENAEQSGQLDVRAWEEAYLQPGRFDQDAMIAMLQELGTSGERRGTGVTRLWTNMEWALLDRRGVHDILEYESRVNDILPKYDMATICSYDLVEIQRSTNGGRAAHPSAGHRRRNPAGESVLRATDRISSRVGKPQK
jgi:hypothetical protein